MNWAEGLAAGYLAEAKVDYVGLWQIAAHAREDLGLTSQSDIMVAAMNVVRGMVDGGLRPGDYLASGFQYWPESDADVAVARIEREWTRLGHDPNLAQPICWFAPAPK